MEQIGQNEIVHFKRAVTSFLQQLTKCKNQIGFRNDIQIYIYIFMFNQILRNFIAKSLLLF